MRVAAGTTNGFRRSLPSLFCDHKGHPMADSTGKRVLITGSGSGIGRDAALRLAKRGHTIYATTHTEEQATALNGLGSGVEAFKVDITDPDDRSRAAVLPVDVLINNAAVGQSGSLAEVPSNGFGRPLKQTCSRR
jgi:NAD(P)-dependent dehydrogenase (short-subunit alcohol dehydrogenase family)